MARATLTHTPTQAGLVLVGLLVGLAALWAPPAVMAQPLDPALAADDAEGVAARRALRAERLVARARALASGGNRVSALGTFREAVQIDPRAVAAYIGLADLYEQAGRVGDAFDAVRVGLARQPRSTPLQMRLARLHQRTGEPREALGLLRRVIQADPNHEAALWAYVEVAQELGAWSEALRGARRLKALADSAPVEPANAAEIDLRVRALSLLGRPLDGACRAETPIVRALCERGR